jgi:hypothetical protein
MPPIKKYTVTETREVTVEAQDPLSAAYVAQVEFDPPNEGVNSLESRAVLNGQATSEVRVKDLEIREAY